MADERPGSDSTAPTSRMSFGMRKSLLILVVIALLLGVAAAKRLWAADSRTATGSAESVTSVHNDASADYDAALRRGKPVYLLFHSLTCQPCVEISAVADKVVPDYEGRVVFVNAITDDASGQKLAAGFSFRYIPTSFFIRADGTVAESFTGAMDEAQMRAHLDSLVGER